MVGSFESRYLVYHSDFRRQHKTKRFGRTSDHGVDAVFAKNTVLIVPDNLVNMRGWSF